MSHLELVRIWQAAPNYYDILTVQGRSLWTKTLLIGDNATDEAIIRPSSMYLPWHHDPEYYDMPAWLTPTVEHLLETHSLPFTLVFEVESKEVCTLLGTVKWVDGQLSIEPIKEIGA